jgi:hypothetical protein
MLFALDYFYGSVEFVPEFNVVNAQGERWLATGRRYEQEIAAFHLGAGLAYRLGKRQPSAQPYKVPSRTY